MIIFLLLATLLVSFTLWFIYTVWNKKQAPLTVKGAATGHITEPATELTADNAPDLDWQVMLAKRNEIENDLFLPQQTRASLRQEWVQMTDAVLSRQQKPNQSPDLSTTLERHIHHQHHTWWILIFSTACALAIYSLIGNWSTEALRLSKPPSTSIGSADAVHANADNTRHPGSNNNIETMISQLEKKLQQSPDNLDGWMLLARSRGVNRDFVGASAALEQALRLAPGHPDILADLADTLAMTNQKSLDGRPTELIQQALQHDPSHPKALSLAATAAMQRNDTSLAKEYWQRLRTSIPSEAADIAKVDAVLAELDVTNPLSSAGATPSIRGHVVLSPKLATLLNQSGLSENATLFIVAKSSSGGPGMPLAVVRYPARQLLAQKVLEFTLDDNSAMDPSLKLSSQSEVNLEARISMAGTAMKKSGDLYVTQPSIKLGTNNVRLEVQSVLP